MKVSRPVHVGRGVLWTGRLNLGTACDALDPRTGRASAIDQSIFASFRSFISTVLPASMPTSW
jgi:hypothetical protein